MRPLIVALAALVLGFLAGVFLSSLIGTLALLAGCVGGGGHP